MTHTPPPPADATGRAPALALVTMLLLTPLVTGCLTDVPAPLGATSEGGSQPDDLGSANVSGDPGNATTPRFGNATLVSGSGGGAEPVVAVTEDGTIFLEGLGGGNNLWRSRDDGASWTDVTPQAGGKQVAFDGFVATGHGGTVYFSNALAGTLRIYRSTDLGETWIPLTPPPVSEPMHRMWIVPTGDATLHVLAERLTEPHVWYMRSSDQGTTWSFVNLVDRRTHFGSDLAVGPEGGLFNVRLDDAYGANGSNPLPPTPGSHGTPEDAPEDGSTCARATESGWVLTRSRDGGVTWTTHPMFPSGGSGCSRLASSWQSLEVDPQGTLYFLWSWQRNGTSLVHLSTSTDGGETWSTPQPIAPHRGAQALPWSAIRAPGELGVTWYGTDEQGDTEALDVPWYAEYALIEDADSANFTAHVTRVSDDPLHVGNICTKGPQCETGESRELLDFTWVTFGPDQRAHLAYGATEWGNGEANPVYAGEQMPFGVG